MHTLILFSFFSYSVFQIFRLRNYLESYESKISQLQEQINSKERQLKQNVSPLITHFQTPSGHERAFIEKLRSIGRNSLIAGYYE